MSMAASSETTLLLLEARHNNHSVVDRLYPIVYDELQRIAHSLLTNERQGHTLSTTALVHEAYLRLVDQTRVEWQDRAHFCAVAAGAMRRILVDYARRRHAAKRGGRQDPLPLDEARVAINGQAELVISLDESLTRLGALDERLSKVVECRFFGGLTDDETAEVLQVSSRTVRRDWVRAKAWLFKELYPDRV
jgi:RNA polymerase sigma factor (TIGR02999 family)